MKRLNCILLMIMLVFSSSLVFAEGNETVTKTNVENEIKSFNDNQQEVQFKSHALLRINNKFVKETPEKGYPFISNKTVFYVPVKLIAEELGYTVTFDEASQSVTIDDRVYLEIGKSKSGNIDLGGKVAVINGVLYAPVSLCNEVLGLTVDFKTVYGMSLIDITGEKLSDNTEIEDKTSEEKKENEKTELTDSEKKDGVVPHDIKYTGFEYTNRSGGVGGIIGSNENNQKTDRPKDSSFEQDREYFNYLTGNYGRKVNKYGQFTYEELINESVSDTQVGFKISRKQNQPVIHCWDWAIEETTYRPRVVHMNLAMEGFKYYAKTDEDGKSIWAYVDNAVQTHTDLDTGKVHKFGQTKVKFHDPGFWGIDVVFVNDRDADEVVDIKEEQPLRINNKFISKTPEKGYSFISNNSDIYVPVKLVSEELGHAFKYDKSTKRVTINNSVNLQVGKSMCGDIDLGGKVVIINDVIYTPVSFYIEVLGIKVDFKNIDGVFYLDINGQKSTKKNQKTELTDEEKKEGVIPHDIKYTGFEYINRDGWLGGRIGSNEFNTKTNRFEESTFYQDRKYFNSLTNNSIYKVNIYGSLNYITQEEKYVDDSQVGFKISRNKNDEVIVHCWDWNGKGGTTSSQKILHMNLAMEGFKYYAKTDEDGKAIWAYLDKAFKHLEEIGGICDGKAIHKFGHTKVRFEKPDHWGIDVVFMNESNVDEEKETIKTELTDYEKKEGVVAHNTKYTGLEYIDKEGRLGANIGSSKNNKKTNRPKDATFEQDREYFNYLTGDGGKKINIYGSLTIERLINVSVSDFPLGFKISRKQNNEPVIHCWDWDDIGGTNDRYKILHMNLAMEGLKYYAKTDEDGKAIWVYLDRVFKTGMYTCDGKVHKFGQTKVRFEEPDHWGVNVVFIND